MAVVYRTVALALLVAAAFVLTTHQSTTPSTLGSGVSLSRTLLRPGRINGFVQCPPAWLSGPCKVTLASQIAAAPIGAVPVSFRGTACRASGKNFAAAAGPSLVITGNNVDLTDSIVDYANNKLGSVLQKYKDFVKNAEVHLTINKNPSQREIAHKIEVTIYVRDSQIVRGTISSVSEYSSIDLVADLINRKLRKYKERKFDKRVVPGVRTFYGNDIAETDAEDMVGEGMDDIQGPYDNIPEGYEGQDVTLVRKKSFPMPPITMEDATLCLDYLDHDFYVFRNSETNEINVVYRRAEGGVGLIAPETA